MVKDFRLLNTLLHDLNNARIARDKAYKQCKPRIEQQTKEKYEYILGLLADYLTDHLCRANPDVPQHWVSKWDVEDAIEQGKKTADELIVHRRSRGPKQET